MTDVRRGPQRAGRRPFDRYTAVLLVSVDVGAVDYADAVERVGALVADVRPRLAASLRHHRLGSPELDAVVVEPGLISRKAD